MPAEPELRRAVVDRITEGVAVLLVGPDESEQHLPAERLPDGAGEGTWLLVAGSDDRLTIEGVDTEGQAARQEEVEQRLERLRRSRRGGRFGGT